VRNIIPGDVVQIDPEHDSVFGGHFLVVTEVASWGVQGYVPVLENRRDLAVSCPLAYYRAAFSQIKRIGHAEWMASSKTDMGESEE